MERGTIVLLFTTFAAGSVVCIAWIASWVRRRTGLRRLDRWEAHVSEVADPMKRDRVVRLDADRVPKSHHVVG
jgi:hypothetical protein